ncbi:coiled-coil-helix-coiled-coil-helix domain containing 6b [Xenentodon cancila]
MGGNGSTGRTVSFGLDEDEKVTVIEGVKLSADVLRRMRESQGSGSTKPPTPPSDNPASPTPSGPSGTEIHEEMRKSFERQQALVQEQLAKLAQKERETAAVTGLDERSPPVITQRGKAFQEQEQASILAKQLERKEKELSTISGFYKEQLEILEKKNFDNYKQASEQYSQAASKAEAHIRPRQTASLCAELQAQVLQCYRENPQQTLHCSDLAKQYMRCVQEAKKGPVMNHG